MPTIELEDVYKSYRVTRQRPFLAREIFRRLVQKPSQVERYEALRGVTFSVEQGEAVGVIGPNGSGKSTLLSLVAGTSYPSSGRVRVEGRIGPLLELGAGFHPDLTGYENIFLNASLLGLSRDEVEAKLPSIIDYSEIGEFVYAPIQTYSTGMVSRLGFAVVAHIQPAVLLIDEALSVGDAHFSAKCAATMRSFVARGTTLLLVSHSLSTVAELCDRVIWLESGRIREQGETAAILEHYATSTGSAPG